MWVVVNCGLNREQWHEEEPKNQKIMETLKEAFTTWWKYPQAIQIWKDAFNLLFYRSAQLTWSGETDSSKEAQINSIVQAQKWWVGNSRLNLEYEEGVVFACSLSVIMRVFFPWHGDLVRFLLLWPYCFICCLWQEVGYDSSAISMAPG